MNLPKALVLWALLLAAALAVFVFSGAYDVGADVPHWGVTSELLEFSRDRSIEAHAGGIKPPNLEDPRLIAIGAEHYSEMCTGCHLAPGMEETEIRQGLYPVPPRLAEPWPSDPVEEFWVIKHGLKFTAMPAWGKTHDDETIWGLVAFLHKLQGMTPEQYSAITAGASDEHPHHDHAN